MEVVQLSVFLENAAGRLAEVAEVLAASSVNVRALALADMAEFGILRLVADDTARAQAALTAAGFTASTTPVVAVSIPDGPGGLAAVLRSEPIRNSSIGCGPKPVREAATQFCSGP